VNIAVTLVQMHGSHEVLFTRPRELTEKIIEASERNRTDLMAATSVHTR
jgi:hypothetical protein